MARPTRFLLMQMRNLDDPMRANEVGAFARSLRVDPSSIAEFDLVLGEPTERDLAAIDVVLLGGSGHFSVVEGGPWLQGALRFMRTLHDQSIPTFASCFGFQAMALALGGQVVTHPERAEVGLYSLQLTEAGREDPVFGPLGNSFPAILGHQDCVDVLPDGAICLASSELVKNQAYRIEGRPIYFTQFHPELSRSDLLSRISAYPHYVEDVRGIGFEEFSATIHDTPYTEALLPRFLDLVR